jgi:hypothetical protein
VGGGGDWAYGCVRVGAQAQTCAFARVTLLIQHAARIHHIAICGLSSSQVPVTLVGLTLMLNFLDQKKKSNYQVLSKSV